MRWTVFERQEIEQLDDLQYAQKVAQYNPVKSSDDLADIFTFVLERNIRKEDSSYEYILEEWDSPAFEAMDKMRETIDGVQAFIQEYGSRW